MSLTYDQKSEIRIAFDEAFVAPERRRSTRVKHQVQAQINEWKGSQEGEPFSIQIEDFSPTGVGMVHTSALAIGSQYLLKVPRQQWGELIVLLTAARCEQREDGSFDVGMELSTVMDRTAMGKFVDAMQTHRHTSLRTRFLLLLLGVFGLTMALLLG